MSDFDKERDEVMPMLASGVSNALVGIYGKAIDFVLIVMVPDAHDPSYAHCSTITGIKEPHKMRLIAQHLNTMADKQEAENLNPDDDSDVQGHA